ncbi:MAG: phosphogluconate dehydrogenase C-terminal domain-containing protein [Thermoproteota archaeon]
MDENRMKVSIIGAAGKMGTRITNNLLKRGDRYELFLCEKGEGAIKLRKRGLKNINVEDAVTKSDIVIMAVPDSKIGEISERIVPLMNKNAMLILLDPAAAYAGELTLRDDCTFIVVHPCHPPLFGEQETPEAREDLFGGIAAKQDIVIALVKGDEVLFRVAEQICIDMFAPVVKCHKITLEQMVLLEPAAAEVVVAAAACIMKEALDEVMRRGVPEEAARAFILGHTQIPLAIVFGKVSSPFSDAAKIAIRHGYEKVFRREWKEVFKPEIIREVIHDMLHP